MDNALGERYIKQILLKSIEAAAFKNNNNNPSPFEDSAIDKIAYYSLGLPGEAARLAFLCLKNAYQIGISKIDAKLVENTALNAIIHEVKLFK
jgi:hypothetical protein